jgi:hypothetical protein
VPQTEVEVASRDRLLHGIGMTFKLIADRSADEVGALE